METKNIYVEKFNQFKEWVDNVDLSNWNKESLFAIFSSLAEKDGHEMRLHLASDGNGSGDISYFFFEDCGGEEDRDIEKYLTVSPTPMGAWELFLLKSASFLMPVFWHGGYNIHYFVFCEDDLRHAGMELDRGHAPMANLDLDPIIGSYDLLPHVTLSEGQEHGVFSADIYCCLWNDWVGLERVHSRLSMKDDIVTIKHDPAFVIYSYECGLRF